MDARVVTNHQLASLVQSCDRSAYRMRLASDMLGIAIVISFFILTTSFEGLFWWSVGGGLVLSIPHSMILGAAEKLGREARAYRVYASIPKGRITSPKTEADLAPVDIHLGSEVGFAKEREKNHPKSAHAVSRRIEALDLAYEGSNAVQIAMAAEAGGIDPFPFKVLKKEVAWAKGDLVRGRAQAYSKSMERIREKAYQLQGPFAKKLGGAKPLEQPFDSELYVNSVRERLLSKLQEIKKLLKSEDWQNIEEFSQIDYEDAVETFDLVLDNSSLSRPLQPADVDCWDLYLTSLQTTIQREIDESCPKLNARLDRLKKEAESYEKYRASFQKLDQRREEIAKKEKYQEKQAALIKLVKDYEVLFKKAKRLSWKEQKEGVKAVWQRVVRRLPFERYLLSQEKATSRFKWKMNCINDLIEGDLNLLYLKFSKERDLLSYKIASMGETSASQLKSLENRIDRLYKDILESRESHLNQALTRLHKIKGASHPTFKSLMGKLRELKDKKGYEYRKSLRLLLIEAEEALGHEWKLEKAKALIRENYAPQFRRLEKEAQDEKITPNKIDSLYRRVLLETRGRVRYRGEHLEGNVVDSTHEHLRREDLAYRGVNIFKRVFLQVVASLVMVVVAIIFYDNPWVFYGLSSLVCVLHPLINRNLENRHRKIVELRLRAILSWDSNPALEAYTRYRGGKILERPHIPSRKEIPRVEMNLRILDTN